MGKLISARPAEEPLAPKNLPSAACVEELPAQAASSASVPDSILPPVPRSSTRRRRSFGPHLRDRQQEASAEPIRLRAVMTADKESMVDDTCKDMKVEDIAGEGAGAGAGGV